jgi:hypothetical protein
MTIILGLIETILLTKFHPFWTFLDSAAHTLQYTFSASGLGHLFFFG